MSIELRYIILTKVSRCIMILESREYYRGRNWPIFFKLLSPIERRILYAIATEELSTTSIANKCLRNSEDIAASLTDLKNNQIIGCCDVGRSIEAVWYAIDCDFARYCQGLAPETIFNPEEIASELTEEFYRLAAKRYERIRDLGVDLSLTTVHRTIAQKFRQQS